MSCILRFDLLALRYPKWLSDIYDIRPGGSQIARHVASLLGLLSSRRSAPVGAQHYYYCRGSLEIDRRQGVPTFLLLVKLFSSRTHKRLTVVVMQKTKITGEDDPETSYSMGTEQIELRIGGMTCSRCPPVIERALASAPGVRSAQVNLSSNIARIQYEPSQTKFAEVMQAIRSLGYCQAPHPD